MSLAYVVMNILLFYDMCIQCVGQVYTVCVPLEHNPDKMYIQRTNPMGT